MKEILVLVGFMGLMLMFLWVVVTCMEKISKRVKDKEEVIKKGGRGEGINGGDSWDSCIRGEFKKRFC